ncbi:MAG TPA: bifunctional precorrin-2 dehydrogenase/sirohydrochlorin ferrochelatase [Longimicrobium sp.]|nr:bifunctional precorrin-2 dehydrogenase/sirohydrochlorin ferrochelatase [Longimicrobium sp.]
MSGRYPVMLDVSRLRVLVVGGGEVALRKVRGVIDAGGKPSVLSPTVVPELERLVAQHGLDWRSRRYEDGDVRGFTLVFAATDVPEVNDAVAREAEAAGALVNAADDGADSTFHVPAVIRRADVVVALSTGGASPLLSRRLRERLEAVVTPALGRTATRLADVRDRVRQRWPADEARRRDAWFSLVTPEFLDAAIAGRDAEVEHRIDRCLSQS